MSTYSLTEHKFLIFIFSLRVLINKAGFIFVQKRLRKFEKEEADHFETKEGSRCFNLTKHFSVHTTGFFTLSLPKH